MTTDTDIANRALVAIAARSRIANFNENSPEAINVRLLFIPTRQALLRGAHWNFCRATAYLSLLKSAPGTPENPSGAAAWTPAFPAPPWLYEYDYPNDCLAIRYITPQFNQGGELGSQMFSIPAIATIPYVGMTPQRFIVSTDKIDGNDRTVILSNQQQAIGVYTRDITNPGLWDSRFQEAMSASLGSQLAMALSGNLNMAKLQAGIALAKLQQAQASDGNEGLTIDDHIPDWLRVRGYTGDWTSPNGFFWGSWVTPSFLLI